MSIIVKLTFILHTVIKTLATLRIKVLLVFVKMYQESFEQCLSSSYNLFDNL